MTSYTFYTIYTVIDIGDGSTIKDGNLTSGMNLNRLLESIMVHSYPMMVSVSKDDIDMTKNNNSTYYSLPDDWGHCVVSTFKFSLPKDVDINLDGIPLVRPTVVNGYRINKFMSTGSDGSLPNISISKQTFSYVR